MIKTKFVYAVTSDESDIYLEQTYVSIYSLKKYNPDAYIVLVVDDKTDKTISGLRQYILEIITEKVVIVPPCHYTKVERSRYLKTTLRNNIDGNYLFIDSDTVVCEDLSAVDSFDADMCAVMDYHVTLDKHEMLATVIEHAKKINWDLSPMGYKYYNSGVMYVKDCLRTRELYRRWNEEWTNFCSSSNFPVPSDQPSLGMINEQMGYVIKEINGIWNCQISGNGLRFMDTAKIIHYFSSTIKKGKTTNVYDLMNNEFFSVLKHTGKLDEKLLDIINHPKSHFAEKLILISGDNLDIYSSPLVKRIILIYQNQRFLFNLLNNICVKIHIFSYYLKYNYQRIKKRNKHNRI